MSPDEIRATIVSILRDLAPETDPSALDPHADLREELDLDSMDYLAYVAALHDRLGVTVPERDYAAVGTLDRAISYIAARRR